jgi:hypothetical protein
LKVVEHRSVAPAWQLAEASAAFTSQVFPADGFSSSRPNDDALLGRRRAAIDQSLHVVEGIRQSRDEMQIRARWVNASQHRLPSPAK